MEARLEVRVLPVECEEGAGSHSKRRKVMNKDQALFVRGLIELHQSLTELMQRPALAIAECGNEDRNEELTNTIRLVAQVKRELEAQ